MVRSSAVDGIVKVLGEIKVRAEVAAAS